MIIRKAVVDDSAALARIQVDSYRSEYAGIMPPDYLAHFTYQEQQQDWRDLLACEEPPLLLVAEADSGEIAGYALGRPGPADVEPFDSELVALHVRRPVQRMGVGRLLVAALVQALEQQGCTSLMLWVLAENTARSFYARLGGRLVAQRTIEPGVGDVTVVEVAYGWQSLEELGTACARGAAGGDD